MNDQERVILARRAATFVGEMLRCHPRFRPAMEGMSPLELDNTRKVFEEGFWLLLGNGPIPFVDNSPEWGVFP